MTLKSHVLFIVPNGHPNPALVSVFRDGGMSVSAMARPDQVGPRQNGTRPNQIWPNLIWPNLILFDTEIPPPAGMGALQGLHDDYDAGLIVLCGKADSLACILGLEMGADDVVERNRDPREIFARGKRLLLRLEEARSASGTHRAISFAGWRLDVNCRQLTDPDGGSVRLTRGEFNLLAALAGSPGQVMSRDTLLDRISHREWAPNDRTVDVLINRLRRKLNEDPREPRHIVTVHGIGYVLQP